MPSISGIFPSGEGLSPRGDISGVNADGQDGTFISKFAENVALWSNDHGPTSVCEHGVGAGSINGEHEGLIFNGTGDGKCSPMGVANVGPACADGKCLSPKGKTCTEEFREPQVVANSRTDAKVRCRPVICDDVTSGREAIGFTLEGVDFGVLSEQFLPRGDDRHHILGCAAGGSGTGS